MLEIIPLNMNFENGFGKNDTPEQKGLQEAQKGRLTGQNQGLNLENFYKQGFSDAQKNQESQGFSSGKAENEIAISRAPDANGLQIEEQFGDVASTLVESWDASNGTPLTSAKKAELSKSVGKIQDSLTAELTAVDARKMNPDEYAQKLISIQEEHLAKLQQVPEEAHGLIHGVAAKGNAEQRQKDTASLDMKKQFDTKMAEYIAQKAILTKIESRQQVAKTEAAERMTAWVNLRDAGNILWPEGTPRQVAEAKR